MYSELLAFVSVMKSVKITKLLPVHYIRSPFNIFQIVTISSCNLSCDDIAFINVVILRLLKLNTKCDILGCYRGDAEDSSFRHNAVSLGIVYPDPMNMKKIYVLGNTTKERNHLLSVLPIYE